MPFKDGSYDDAEFWDQVRSDTPTLLGFWNHDCAPCKVKATVFERHGKRFKRSMEFVAVSVYDRPDIAQRFGLSSTPTFIVTRRGKALRHFYGVVHERIMAEHLEPLALPTLVAAAEDEKPGLLARLFRH